MILDFTIKNFRSLRNEMKIILEGESGQTKSENTFEILGPNGKKRKLLRSAVIYGANASGKTNVIRALYNLINYIKQSNDLSIDQQIPWYDPFLFDTETEKEPTVFSLNFLIKEGEVYIQYNYKLSFNREEIIYEAQHREDLLANMVTHVQKMAKVIANAAPYYRGLNYEIADIRDVLNCDDPRAIILCNPPAYAGGYEQMFRLDGIAEWNAKIAQFNYNKEAWGMYCRAKERQSHIIWYKGKDLYFVNGKQKERVPSKDIIFCKEYSLLRNDYWLSTKPAELKDCPATYSVIMTKHVEAKPFKNAKIIGNTFKDIVGNYNDAALKVKSDNGQIMNNVFINCTNTNTAVSYTHLTLPTIYSV